MAGFKEFKTKVAPARAFIIQANGPCPGCGRLIAQQLFVSLGNRGGSDARNLKAIEANLGLCDVCREAKTR